LIEKAYTQLLGEAPDEGGHYITVWAPRQCGKTWAMLEVFFRLEKNPQFDVVKIDLEHLKTETDVEYIASSIAEIILSDLEKEEKATDIRSLKAFQEMFSRKVLDKPLILILDEFDSLHEDAINRLTSIFRNIYNSRKKESGHPLNERKHLLHGVALIGVRSVLGIENIKGSPFNVQRSLHIPNLTYEEVDGMFKWYEKESGQAVEQAVIERLFYETGGQPGLTCWFGELLTEGFEDFAPDKTKPITIREFDIVYAAATYALPNNNILNIISKAKQEPVKTFILDMFQTDEKIGFRFDNTIINALYMNGVVEKEIVEQTRYYVKFSCPFVQKRLFNYFSDELFSYVGRLVEPFVNLDDVITDTDLNIKNLMKLYQQYLIKNSQWLFKDAPRRSDLNLFEAVFHFNLYAYLNEFLKEKGGRVFPEFPTGNGKIDLLVTYKDKTYGIELKSYTDQSGYRIALERAAQYGKQLGLAEIFLVFFVERIDDRSRQTYEKDLIDRKTNVIVAPLFIETGETY
jgi:hypothetical protein